VNKTESETHRLVDALYAAYLAGDPDGMLAQMDDDVDVRFLAQGTFHGRPAVRRFMHFSAGLLSDLDFRIDHRIFDGDTACVIWSETATTAAGKLWENHGVDVIRVCNGKVVVLHENNDVNLVYENFPPYVDRG
jgi:ketosteroid isomerase-like protein